MAEPVRVHILDSRDEFRPPKSGGYINWPMFIAGVIMALFGILCIAFPSAVLVGFVYIGAIGFIVAGAILLAGRIRVRNTLFADSGLTTFFSCLLIILGVVLCLSPVVGVTVVAVLVGLGLIVFGLVQLLLGREYHVMGTRLWLVPVVSGVIEIILGILTIVHSDTLGVLIGIFAIIFSIELIVFSLPVGRSTPKGMW